MKMYQIEVYTDGPYNDIHLKQSSFDDDESVIVLSQEQAKFVAQWIFNFVGEKKCTTTTSI